MQFEETLTGGNMSVVARVGDTVRRQAGSWTPRTHRLLAHLRAKGIREVPAPLGFDDQGREILTFIPGTVGHTATMELRTDAATPGLTTEALLRNAPESEDNQFKIPPVFE
jgi:hypothetical protein